MRRLFVICLVMFVFLTGCGGNSSDSGKELNAPTEASTTESRDNHDMAQKRGGNKQFDLGKPWYENDSNVAPKFKEKDLILDLADYWVDEVDFDLIGYAEDLGFVNLLYDGTDYFNGLYKGRAYVGGFFDGEQDVMFAYYHDGDSESNICQTTVWFGDSITNRLRVEVVENGSAVHYEPELPNASSHNVSSYRITNLRAFVGDIELKTMIAALNNVVKGDGDYTVNPIPESVDFDLK